MDVRPVPVGHLHQHARGIRVHLAARAAHDSGDRGGAFSVLDQDHVVVERAQLAVQRLDLFAVARPAHGQPRTGDPVEVEGV